MKNNGIKVEKIVDLSTLLFVEDLHLNNFNKAKQKSLRIKFHYLTPNKKLDSSIQNKDFLILVLFKSCYHRSLGCVKGKCYSDSSP